MSGFVYPPSGGGAGTVSRVQSTDLSTLTVANPTGPTVTLTALVGAVAQLLAGANIVLSPATGKGDVTIGVPGPVTFTGDLTVQTATEIVLGSTTHAQLILTVGTSTALLRALIAVVIELSGGSASLRMSSGSAALTTTGASSTARVEASGTGATARLISTAYALIEAGARITLVVAGVTESLFTYTGDPNGHVPPGYQGSICLTPTGLWRAAGVGETTWEKLGVSTSVFPTLSGIVTPVGNVTGTRGDTYVDTTTGTIGIYVGTAPGNTAWALIKATTTLLSVTLGTSAVRVSATVAELTAGHVIVLNTDGNGVNVFVYVTGNPNGHVTAEEEGCWCFTLTGLWRSTAAGTTSWIAVGGGAALDVTVNSDAVTSSGLLPLQITKQPLVPPSGIVQPLPPLMGFQFPGQCLYHPLTKQPKGGICVGRDRNIWISAGLSVLVIEPSTGTVLHTFAVDVVTAGTNTWRGPICSGPDGNIWKAGAITGVTPATRTGRVARITPSGTVAYFTPATATHFAFRNIVAASDGHLYAVGGGTPAYTTPPIEVWKFTPTGAGTKVFTSATLSAIGAMCAAPDGNVWVVVHTNTVGTQILVIEPDGSTSLHPVRLTLPYAMCAGPDGAVWTVSPEGRVYRITPVHFTTGTTIRTVSTVHGIVSGPGGDLWVSGSSLAQITVEGVVTTFPFTGGGSGKGSWLCVGPDNAFWVTDLTTPDVYSLGFLVQEFGLVLTALPTADPHNKGEIWNTITATISTLRVSAG